MGHTAILLIAALLADAATQDTPKTAPEGATAVADARYAEVEPGVLRDSRTGLDWTADTSAAPAQWHEASRACAARGERWRLPEADELAALIDRDGGASTACGTKACAVSKRFTLREASHWSATRERPISATVVSLSSGRRASIDATLSHARHFLCVRAPQPAGETDAAPGSEPAGARGAETRSR